CPSHQLFGGVVRHGADSRRGHPGSDRAQLRPATGVDHLRAGPPNAHLPADRHVRPLRPAGPGPAMGADGQGGPAALRGGDPGVPARRPCRATNNCPASRIVSVTTSIIAAIALVSGVTPCRVWPKM